MAASTTSFMLQVQLPGGRIAAVMCARKQVKNFNLRVHADGTVALSLPERAGAGAAQAFLDSRADWIGRQLDRLERATAEQAARDAAEMREGTLPLWGERVDAVRALGPELGAGLHELTAEERQARVDGLYRREVIAALPGVCGPLEARIGTTACSWQVRTMKTRWGSCTPKTGAIRVNSGLAAYPPCCLEAVVAHELVHLLEPTHNARFHVLLDACCPGNRAAMELLKRPPAC